jgi:hypothetical protein
VSALGWLYRNQENKSYSSRRKKELEIKKLELDTLYVKRTFFVQIANLLTLATAGIAALYFFQRPQIEMMEAARLSNEALQLDSMAIAILQFKDDEDKIAAFDRLASQWPRHTFLVDLARSMRALVAAKTEAVDCSGLDKQIASLVAELVKLQDDLRAEVQGVNNRLSGFGPHARSIEVQVRQLAAEIERLKASRQARNCRG